MNAYDILVPLGLIAVLVWFGYLVVKGYKSAGAPKTHVCPNCRSAVDPVRMRPGSTFLEVLLWLFFLVPGLLYTAYRQTKKHLACPVCGAPNPVPASTPAGQALTVR